jgi:hypothetical protein
VTALVAVESPQAARMGAATAAVARVPPIFRIVRRDNDLDWGDGPTISSPAGGFWSFIENSFVFNSFH